MFTFVLPLAAGCFLLISVDLLVIVLSGIHVSDERQAL
jgi:hypothetical protein